MSGRKSQKIAALLESAVQKIRQGQAAQARLICEQVLQLSPRHPDALHLLGVIALQAGDPERALEPLRQAAAIEPGHADYLANLAHAYAGLARYEEALGTFERAVRLAPGDPALQMGLGNCYGMLGKPAEAEAVFRRMIERHPHYPLGWFNLANALKDLERHEEARDAYFHVTQLAPQFAEAHCNLGHMLHKLSRFEEAERSFRTAISLKGGFVPAYVSLAITLNSMRRHAEAEALAREALARDAGLDNAWPVLGRALAGQGRWREALHSYERAVQAFPSSTQALGDLGDVLARLGRTREALDAFDRAYAMGNVSHFVRFAKASALFGAGLLAEGAAEYAGRSEHVMFERQFPGLPLATQLPPDMSGQTVSLIGEQGIGDELFFLRFAPRLKARGCRIHYYGNPKITPLLARCEALDRVDSHQASYPRADATVLAGDLPHLLAPLSASMLTPRAAAPAVESPAAALKTRFPWLCRVYCPPPPPPLSLQPLPDRLAAAAERLQRLGPPPYVGLTWRAGTGPEGQRGNLWFLFKDIALEALARGLRDTAATFVSLQRAPRAGETEQLAALLGRPVHDLSDANDDLESMLAVLARLDDYIGVSSTNMHLHAGLGKTARLLVPWPAEWRWLTAGETSPWFPGFRVYRQNPDGGWNDAIERLHDDLAAAPRPR